MIKKVYKLLYKNLVSANRYARESGVIFGKNCKFLTNKFGSEPYLIKIGDNFYSSSNVQFVTHDGSVNVLRNKYGEYSNIDIFKPIMIGNNVFLGYGVVILPGTVIGDNVIVGACSVVKGELQSDSVYAGMPAKYICSIDEYLSKNRDSFIQTKNMSLKEKKEYVLNWVKKKYPEF